MDDHVFDRLTRVLGTSGSRRAAVGALVAASPLAAMLETAAKKRKARHNGNGKDKDKGGKDKKDHGKGKGKDKGKAKAQATSCWRSGACILKKGANASQCNLTGYTAPSNLNCTGCNISRANLRGANLSGANLTKANLSGACLTDAILTGAIIANNTNMANAVICRTRMSDGSLSDAGCGLGSECCPVCDATHPCPAGQLCCGGRCVTGNCCEAGDCADQTCRGKECTNNTCTYTPDGDGGPGAGCADPLQCCNGTCCPSGQKCCGGQCIDANRCCTNNVPDACADNGRCCEGECLLPTECCNEGQIGCPAGKTCIAGTGPEPICCEEERTCGEQCCPPLFTKCCGGQCVPLTTCCTDGQIGACPAGKRCCNSGNCHTCCAPGNFCENSEQCSGSTEDDDEFCGSSGAGLGAICTTFPGIHCCLVFNTACTEDEQCCSGSCGHFLGADVCT